MLSKSIHVVANGKISFFKKKMSSIPLCIYTTSSLSNHLLMPKLPLWTLEYINLFELVFLFFLDIYPEVEFLVGWHH